MNLPTLNITIEAFAAAAEAIGTRQQTLDLPQSCSITEAWAALMKAHPQLQDLDASIAFAINNQLVDRGTILQDGDRLAILPPVSGG